MNAPLRKLSAVVTVLFLALFGSSSVIQFVQAQALNNRPGNARTVYKEYSRERGPIVAGNVTLATSKPSNDLYRFQRAYPSGPLYTAVTGYYSTALAAATGIEASQSPYLAGTADQLFYRRISDILTGRQPKGASVELTINPKAQQAAWDALGNQRGAVVALDPRTGAVLAMVSKPAFDPNKLASHSRAAAQSAYNTLVKSASRPLENRAIAGSLYPPGSTFKLIVSAAALSSGSYTPDTLVPGPAQLDLRPDTLVPLNNDDRQPCGPNDQVRLADALRISCNTAFGSLGDTLGAKAIADQAARFGFGRPLQIPLTVTPSRFPQTQGKAQLAQASIGQFDVRTTPLQMAMVAAGIANRGVVMQPYLVNRIRSSDLDTVSTADPTPFSTAVTPEVAGQLTSMMEGVVQSGTGVNAQIPGVRVAGKTGTAQTAPGQAPDAWFTSFAPADDPKIAVAVIVENGGGFGEAASGGRVAAPIARAVMEAVVKP
ncbi:MAG: penicillin-binding protein 2 [Pseudonocardiales bacterium]|nr:penicillin-binding protein 2 [Pseudonocardiales bacterium]